MKLQLAHTNNSEPVKYAWLFFKVKRKYQIHKIQYQLLAVYYLLFVSCPIYFGPDIINYPQGVLLKERSGYFLAKFQYLNY